MTWTRTFLAPIEAAPVPAQGQRATMPRLLRLRAVMELTGLSEAGVYAEMKAGRFPRPVKISRRAAAWREDHLITWLASREAITATTLPPAA